jgi:hypothetical protein
VGRGVTELGDRRFPAGHDEPVTTDAESALGSPTQIATGGPGWTQNIARDPAI